MLDVLVYQTADGGQPFIDWYNGLDTQAAVKVATAVRRISDGNLSDSKSVGAGVSERRINWGPGYRIYFGRDGDRLVVLLGGGTKTRQHRDIDDAIACWADYRQRRR